VPFAQYLLLTVYYAFLAVVTAVMTYRAFLILRYYRCAREDEEPGQRFDSEPVVTVQLPLFNERFVVDRLLETVCALDWPRDKLEVQVLDDSTDDTVEIAARKVEELRGRGFDVRHIHRADRSGYKAGALGAALPEARGDYLAIFDADFVPNPDFLRRTVDYFTDLSVGFVQGRWDYLNRSFSPLTQGMGMLMDGHFVFEQTVRSRGGYVFNFNGTAGIWRRAAIQAAGGWQDETICEDTDLSYRAYLAGYRGVYLRDLPVPSELPVQITALKSQQHRWAKGLTECFFKVMPSVVKSELPFRRKLEALFHLGSNLAFPATLFMTVVTLPVMILRMQGAAQGHLAAMVDSFVFLLVAATQILFYVLATKELHRDWVSRMRWLPFFPLVGVGLAVNNARGVLEAFTGLRTEFVRTPKLGVLGGDKKLVKRRERTYTGGRDFWQAVIEIALGGFYVYMGAVQWSLVGFGALVTLVLSLGLFMTGGATLRALWLKSRRARDRQVTAEGAEEPDVVALPAVAHEVVKSL
jgi:cellulose synthase/poly-beta-1,6-N-acetylglucosamine synthase-like glycosyltransferase